MRVRDALGVLFRDEDFLSGEFEGMYSPLGQPGLSPALLLLVTILQFMHNLSDREAAQAVADRISWKYLLGLALDDVGFDASVLSEFRDRLAVGVGRIGCWACCWNGCRRPGWSARVGGSAPMPPTCSPVCAGPDRIEQVGESLRAALEEIARTAPSWLVPLLAPGWDERYGRKVETARLLKRKNASAVVLAEQIGADGRALLDKIDTDPAAGWINDLPQVTLLRTMWPITTTTPAPAACAGRTPPSCPPPTSASSPLRPRRPLQHQVGHRVVGSKAT